MMTEPPTSLLDLAARLRSGDLPLLAYLDQLEKALASRDPEVIAFVPEPDRFERLQKDVLALQARFPQAANRPPLFGVAIGVKDIFHVDGLPTQAGSSLPAERLSGRESAAVTKLKSAGVLILGKTVTTEFAYFGPGPTRNPHNPAHTPGGSSSGSAAAVGAGLCQLALGTQTIGSINRPAAFCGVVGYKPSYERISREGVIPLSPSADHIGFFVPTAGDVAPVAALLCRDWREAGDIAERPVLGIPAGPYLDRAAAEGQEHFRETCQKLAGAGFSLKTVPAMADFEAIFERHYRIVAADAAAVHAEWYAEFSHLYHPKTAELIERGQRVTAEELAAARGGREQLRQELSALMTTEGIDLWLSPAATGPAPLGLESTGNPVMNLPWTHAGLPTLSLPSGLNSSGLPFGLQLTGSWYGDEQLLKWGEKIAAAL